MSVRAPCMPTVPPRSTSRTQRFWRAASRFRNWPRSARSAGDGYATFQGLTLKAARRFKHGLSFDSTYTLSKSIDDASDTGTTNAEYNLPEDPYAMNLEKALSSFDRRQRFTANAVYDLPFGKRNTGMLDRVIGGWRVAEIFTAQSGAPFTINLSSAAGQNVSPTGLVNGNNLERPNLVGDPKQRPSKLRPSGSIPAPSRCRRRALTGTAGAQCGYRTGPGRSRPLIAEGSNSARPAETAIPPGRIQLAESP